MNFFQYLTLTEFSSMNRSILDSSNNIFLPIRTWGIFLVAVFLYRREAEQCKNSAVSCNVMNLDFFISGIREDFCNLAVQDF